MEEPTSPCSLQVPDLKSFEPQQPSRPRRSQAAPRHHNAKAPERGPGATARPPLVEGPKTGSFPKGVDRWGWN